MSTSGLCCGSFVEQYQSRSLNNLTNSSGHFYRCIRTPHFIPQRLHLCNIDYHSPCICTTQKPTNNSNTYTQSICTTKWPNSLSVCLTLSLIFYILSATLSLTLIFYILGTTLSLSHILHIKHNPLSLSYSTY